MRPLGMVCDGVRVLKGSRAILGGFGSGGCSEESEVSLERCRFSFAQNDIYIYMYGADVNQKLSPENK